MAKKQPWGITLTCLFMWIGAAVALVGAVITMALTSVVGAFSTAVFGTIGTLLTTIGVAAGIIGIVMAIVMLFLGWALWKHYTVAWYVVFLLVFVQLIAVIGSMALALTFSPMIFISIALTAVILFALLSKDAMKACKAHLGNYKGIDI